jgi:signal transduction histidine kinase/CheY-like chemotaxis protein
MLLRTFTRTLLAILLTALIGNVALLYGIRRAEDLAQRAQQLRSEADELLDEVVHDNDLLLQLAQRHTLLGSDRDLQVYLEMLAVREGQAPAPMANNLPLYWRELALGGRERVSAPQGEQASLLERMQRLGFDSDELEAGQELLRVSAQLQALEKMAFAAAQGHYDAVNQRFVTRAEPDRAYALGVLGSREYDAARTRLQSVVSHLTSLVQRRTRSAVAHAGAQLNLAIGLTLLVDLALIPVLTFGFLVMRRRVLAPIAALSERAARYREGDFADAAAPPRRAVREVELLERALSGMARAIQADLARRDEDRLALQKAHESATAATAAKSRFLANMSHEIRTPINAIMGMTQLAMQTPLPAETRDYLTKAEGATRMLLGLVNDVLDLSKIEAGHMEVEHAPLVLEQVVAQAIDVVRALRHAQQLELLCEWGDASLLHQGGHLRGDALRLQQVLVNLLSNAVKFTPSGQVTLRLDTETGADPATALLRISVIDTGIGMSAEQLEHLFSEFSQGESSTSRRFGGTGLGLAITRHLVELMGGSIAVSSEPGRGSRFEVTLALSRETQPPATGLPPAQAQARILVAEGLAGTREGVLATLMALGIGAQGRLQAVGDAAALRQALAQGFDWLLLDWLLPDALGAELLAELRRDHPALRIVITSSPQSAELRRQARGLGAQALLVKPLLPSALRGLFSGANDAPLVAAPIPDRQPLAGLRVLLVEDNPINQEVAQRLMSSRGARVELADNGLEALERLQADGAAAYDLVLMDLQMPLLDGIGATQQLRRLPGFDKLPVLAMTARALSEERQRCLAAGMQGHIAKPLDIEQLVRVLRAYRPVGNAAPAPATPAAPLQAPAPQHPAAVVADWPAIDGINIERGLLHFDFSHGLYRRSLRQFAEQYRDGLTDWRSALAADDWVLLRRAAHTLQGPAATLGADPVHLRALDIERAALAHQADRVRAELPALERDLAALVHAILQALDELPEQLQSSHAPLSPQAGPAPGHAHRPALDRLRRLLDRSDSEALDWWQQAREQLAPALGHDLARQLEQAMAALDFDAALAVLHRHSTRPIP